MAILNKLETVVKLTNNLKDQWSGLSDDISTTGNTATWAISGDELLMRVSTPIGNGRPLDLLQMGVSIRIHDIRPINFELDTRHPDMGDLIALIPKAYSLVYSVENIKTYIHEQELGHEFLLSVLSDVFSTTTDLEYPYHGRGQGRSSAAIRGGYGYRGRNHESSITPHGTEDISRFNDRRMYGETHAHGRIHLNPEFNHVHGGVSGGERTTHPKESLGTISVNNVELHGFNNLGCEAKVKLTKQLGVGLTELQRLFSENIEGLIEHVERIEIRDELPKLSGKFTIIRARVKDKKLPVTLNHKRKNSNLTILNMDRRNYIELVINKILLCIENLFMLFHKNNLLVGNWKRFVSLILPNYKVVPITYF